MAKNLVVNEVTYNNVESISMTADNGEKVMYYDESKIDESFEAGKKAEYDAFWDAAQLRRGVLVTYIPYAFAGPTWTDDNFKPKYDIKATGNSHGIFRQTSMVNLKQCLETSGVALDLSKATGLTGAFGYSGHLKILPKLDISSVGTVTNLFQSSTVLESIDELKVSEKNAFNTCFSECAALKHMIVTGTIAKNGFNVQWSTLLDKESLLSIINCLKDYSADTSGTVWKVTIGPTNLAKLTEAEKEIAKNKGWVIE